MLAISGAVSLAARSGGHLPDGIQILIVARVCSPVASLYAVVDPGGVGDPGRELRSLRRKPDELERRLRFQDSHEPSSDKILFAYLVVFWTIALSNFVAQFGFVALCIGMFPAAFWCLAVTGHAVGALAAERAASRPATSEA